MPLHSTTNIDPDTDPTWWKDYLTYLDEQQILVCNICEYAINGKSVGRHFIDHHGETSPTNIPLKIRNRLIAFIPTLTLRPLISTIKIPKHEVPALDCLPRIQGYHCTTCNGLSISLPAIKGGCNRRHHWRESEGKSLSLPFKHG